MGWVNGRIPPRFPEQPSHKESPRDVAASEGTTSKENPMPVTPTIAPITERPDLGAVERMRIELGATPAELIAGYIEDARESLMEAMKTADRLGATDEHRQVGHRVLALDDLMVWLSDRTAS